VFRGIIIELRENLSELMKKRGIRKYYLLCWILTVLLTGSGCQYVFDQDGFDEDETAQTDEGIPVEVTALVEGSIEATVRSFGYIEAEESVMVYSRTANLVANLKVEEGDLVAKGDLLVGLEDENQRIAVSKAQSQLKNAQREQERQKSLYKQELISDKEFLDAEYQVEQMRLSLEDAQTQLSYTEITAPISGTIVIRKVKLGDQVNANQHLFDLVDFNTLIAPVFVPEKFLPMLEVGKEVRIVSTSNENQIIQGRVKRISPIVDKQSGTVKITVAIQEYGPLRPGMHVRVEIIYATHSDALLIPKRALRYDDDLLYVFRLLPKRPGDDLHRVERVILKPEIEDTDNNAGFEIGDQIVITGQTGLKDNRLVRLPTDPKPKKKDDRK